MFKIVGKEVISQHPPDKDSCIHCTVPLDPAIFIGSGTNGSGIFIRKGNQWIQKSSSGGAPVDPEIFVGRGASGSRNLRREERQWIQQSLLRGDASGSRNLPPDGATVDLAIFVGSSASRCRIRHQEGAPGYGFGTFILFSRREFASSLVAHRRSPTVVQDAVRDVLSNVPTGIDILDSRLQILQNLYVSTTEAWCVSRIKYSMEVWIFM